jgi:hypothetical protein
MIRLCCGRKKWNLEKRFNEFHDLNESLKNKHANMPSFPAKTYFSLSKESDVDQRRLHLSHFLKDLVNRVDMRTSSPFRSFLQLDSMIDGSVAFTPVKVAEIADLAQGGRDFVYLPARKMILVAMSEMKVATRIDSYLTNVRTKSS